MFSTKKRETHTTRDKLLQPLSDRRALNHTPDQTNTRSNRDRRGNGSAPHIHGRFEDIQKSADRGQRYHIDCPITIKARPGHAKKVTLHGRIRNISASGILVELSNSSDFTHVSDDPHLALRFRIPGGTMPEGFEMWVKNHARCVRCFEQDGHFFCGLEFEEDLRQYARENKDRRMLLASSVILALVTAVIVLMRIKNVLYFRFHEFTYFYSLLAAAFLLSRYLLAAFYKPVPVDPKFTPGVSIIIPCFNEEEWIQKTITSCLDQNYPTDKLEVIVVDDCSSDHSVERIQECMEQLIRSDGGRSDLQNRIRCIVQPRNSGKREALAEGVTHARHELVVFVDSDSFLHPYAIRCLVQPFRDPKMGGVSGRTDVANTYTNRLTKMQSVRYYIAFRIMKAAESIFDCVTCLSGPLSCYRKDIVLEEKENWLSQKFLGQKATFGDDRSMTNSILRNYRTCYQDTAICSTIVPNDYSVFLKQQMRWKRSWLRESLRAGSFFWRKEPLAAILFYIGLIVPIAAPFIIFYNLLLVPILHHTFPTVFLVGILLMSLLMSGTQLLLRRSSTWPYALWFCLFYEAVLVWQMPIAMLTFWKSTWGTRLTWSDVQELDNPRHFQFPIQEKSEKVPNAAAQRKKRNPPRYIGTPDKRKEWCKGLRTGLELIVILFIVIFLGRTILYPQRYLPYAPAGETEDQGFVAVSYFGINRTGSETMVSSAQLEQQLDALKENGYVTVTQQDLLNYYQNGTPLPEKSLFLMFEDGRMDTAIFSQNALEGHNYIATICGYAQNITADDGAFLNAGDVKELKSNTFWEYGSNGYRLAYINIFDRYQRFIGQMDASEFVQMRPYLDRDYNHYLMDYIRDENRMPSETRQDMQARIRNDYQLMRDIYSDALGDMPALYALMHANTGQYGNLEDASLVNADEMHRSFAMNFNREGSCRNGRDSDLYDLTRMEVSAYWSSNHLLMRMWDDLDGRNKDDIHFVVGDPKKASQWDLRLGAAEFENSRITLTSLPDGIGQITLKDFEIPEGMELELKLNGTLAGQQIIRLGKDLQIRFTQNQLLLRQNGIELGRVDLDTLLGAVSVSVDEDMRDAMAQVYAIRAKSAPNPTVSMAYKRQERLLRQEAPASIAEGADPYIPEIQLYQRGAYRVTLRFTDGCISLWVNGRKAIDQMPVSLNGSTLSLLSGWDQEAFSQRNLAENVYDAEFEDLVIRDLSGRILFSNCPQGMELAAQKAEILWNRVMDWFIVNL